MAGSRWLEQAGSLGRALRTSPRSAGGLLVIGTPDYEPWHVTAHLDDEARLSGVAELTPTLVRWSPPAGAPPHLAVGLARLEAARRGETLFVVAEGTAPVPLLERVYDARKTGATILALDSDDPELDAEADAILRTVGLAKFGDAFPHELSGGMQHRAAFARAIVTRPSLLLMDEPFGALDAITRLRMHDFLLSMWDQYRTTIVFVTHDIEEAVLLGDRVAVMGGRPPGIQEVIDIPLPRPRDALDADTEAFLAAKRRIRAALTV